MKKRELFAIIILSVALTIFLAACGNNEEGAVEENVTITEANIDTSAIADVELKENTSVSAEDLVGEWKDINSPDRFAKITKNGEVYEYEDNDGKYPATYKDSILSVKVAENETAKVYIDQKSAHLILEYQGSITEFAPNNGLH